MNNTTTQTDWSKKELGVLWKRTSKGKSESYYVGTINLKSQGLDKDIPIICFSNKTKNKDSHPDVRIYVSEKKPGATTTAAAPKATKPAPQNTNDLI